MIDKLIRAHIRNFQPYVSARSEVPDARVFLDANELPVNNPVSPDGLRLNRYPDPQQLNLRQAIGEHISVPPEMIFAGVGSDEIIDLLVRLLCEPGRDSVAILEPTYGVYRVAASLNAVRVLGVDLSDDFQIDLPAVTARIGANTKLLFLCSPNNPTGNLLKREDILSLCASTKGIVVADQAYIEFAPAAGDLAREVERFDNLVVLRTFSKAWGLAGMRLGYCIANPQLISYLLRIKSPYTLGAVTTHLALSALKNPSFPRDAAATVVRERVALSERLRDLPAVIGVAPSDSNFLLVRFREAKRVYESLRACGIIVRRRSEQRLADCLRITVGTSEENSRLLSEIGKIV